MSVSKKALKKKFSENWKKHYKVKFLEEQGFKRKKCKKCSKHFWTLDSSREHCADSSCVGFEFIGEKGKQLSYTETWREIEKFFEKRKHKSIQRYPVVARWRDDLYFTNASIIDFQPYVVSGEIEPPANPLIVPQASIRFKDIENVGVTGQHYSSFIMFGQHAFNSKKTGLFYWKNEALEHDFNYLTKAIGVKKEELCFQEDVWVGGGTFGPSIEYCAKGIELGNCVFMQFKDLGNGNYEELKTKVIDMGAGLERIAWYTNGTPTSYDVTFKGILEGMLENASFSLDRNLFFKYSKLSGHLDIENPEFKQQKKKVLKKLGLNEKDYRKKIKPMQAIYACADHLKTILYATADGMLPSNAGGGYNLRMLLRRAFALNKEFSLNLDFDQILEDHAEALKGFDDSLERAVGPASEVVALEHKKERERRKNAKKKISSIVKRAGKGKELEEKELIELYESEGIPVELIEEEAAKKGIEINVPENFYQLIAKKNEIQKTKKTKPSEFNKYPKTKELFYSEKDIEEFNAKVLGVEGKGIVLNRTLFYPGTGGQAPDYGALNGVKVEDVEKHEGVIVHYVEKPSEFKKGKPIVGEIDLKRRKQLARHHTTAHLLNAAARGLLGAHVWQAGAGKEEKKAHLDITHYQRLDSEDLRELELRVNEFIQQSIPVSTVEMNRAGAEKKYGFTLYQGGYVPGKTLRVVNIKGVDVEACSGTHVKNTGEIGFFKILKREGVQDGIERIVFACGIPALKKVHEKEKLLEKTAGIFSVQESELPKTSERFFNEWKDLRKKVKEVKGRVAKNKAGELALRKGNRVKEYFEELDSKTLIKIGNMVTEKKTKAIVVLGSGETIVVMCGSKSEKNAEKELKKLLKKFGGKGGGSKRMGVGKVKKMEKFKKYLNN